jgi:hypothetical protein
LAVEMAVDDFYKGVGEIGLRIDARKFAGLDQRGEDRPVFSAAVGTRESAFLRFSAMGRIERSTMLVSISMRPSSTKRVRPTQWDWV